MGENQVLEPRQECRTILVVDDEPLIRDLCAQALTGYTVLQAEGGSEALEIFRTHPPDVILTDVMMPQMNGLELLRAVKEREPNQAVVVMTGYADKEIILKALKADADDFINKPINLLQLKTTIEKVIEKKTLKEELAHLKRSDRLKSDFLGLISHKLKTPVTGISLFIQNIARGIDDPKDPQFLRTLSLIQEEALYLEYLIEDLLHYSEIILQEGPPRLSSVNLGKLALTILGEMMAAATAKGVHLASSVQEEIPEMNLDRKRIDFSLRALLDNALKFTPSGGTVSLSAALVKGGVELLIVDTGKGIAQAELPKIFEKFYQVDPVRSGQVRGFGLGLFYSRQFIMSHGGSLRMESEEGKGSQVTIFLPFQQLDTD